MRVCLIIPPSSFLLDERVFISLGILKVAAVLEKAGVGVEVLDLSGVSNYLEVISDYCRNVKIDCFGLTATTPQLPASIEIARKIRNLVPNSRIILGGPHITLVNAAHKKEAQKNTGDRASEALGHLKREFDVLVAGDGEEAIFPALEGKNALIDADIPNSPLFLSSKRLNEMPFPARHLVDVDRYRYFIDGVRALSLIAQLGCPFECGFCGGRNSPFLRRIRTRTAEHIIAEIIEIYRRYEIHGFMMYDDELNVNKEMIPLMEKICAVQERLGVRFRFRGFIKSELFTEDQARIMHQAGFRWILVGFESGSPKILNNINKKSDREQNNECLRIARKYGLKVKALMSIGHPGESEETINKTREWLIQNRPDDFDVSIITAYPGTPYYDEAIPATDDPHIWVYTTRKSDDRLYCREIDHRFVADYYKGSPGGGYRSFVHTDYLAPAKLVELRDFVERDVRTKLNIPFNPSAPAIKYEHSMGQSGIIPGFILRSTK